MNRRRLKMLIAGSFLVSSIIFGFRAGERIEANFFERSGLGLVIVMVVHGLVLAPVRRAAPGAPRRLFARQIAPRLIVASAISIAGAGGWKLGELSGQRAMNECLAAGESVRTALALHRQKTGSHPESLEEIGMERVGRRFLNPPLLEYHLEESGYRLDFGDRIVAHRATESEPFHPRK